MIVGVMMPDRLPHVLKMPPHSPYSGRGAISATIVQPRELKPLPKNATDIQTTIQNSESVNRARSIAADNTIPVIMGVFRAVAVLIPIRIIQSEI